MILLLETGLLRGRAPALAVALGLAIARAARVTLAALGLAARCSARIPGPSTRPGWRVAAI